MLLALCVVALCGQAHAGTCKLSIVLDRSDSMTLVRSDGLTRCEVATQGVLDAIGAFIGTDEYVVNFGRTISSTDIYDMTCPASDPTSVKLVSIWGFEGLAENGRISSSRC